jgi:hypothetical protein
VAGKARKFAQVGEWLKPTDCKSVPPCEVRRFESFPVHQVEAVCGRERNGSPQPKSRALFARDLSDSSGARGREGLSEAFDDGAGRVRGFGSFVLDDDQRPANSPGDAGGAGDVCAEDVGAEEGRAASGREGCRDVACYVWLSEAVGRCSSVGRALPW